MSITERLANLEWYKVLIIVAVLLALRFVLLKSKSQFAKSLGETAESLAVAMALVFFIIRPFIVQAFFIPSASMHPTLLEQDHILVNKFVYRFSQPKRGDVVVFKSPHAANPDGQERDFIKRVIGTPGDVIRITPGYVMVGSDQYDHAALRQTLQGLSKIEIRDGRVYEDGKAVPNWEIGLLARPQQPGVPVRVEKDALGQDKVMVGSGDFGTDEYALDRLPDLLRGRHRIKLIDHTIYRDDKKVDPAELAKLAGRPGAKVKVVPGLVYRNGKALNEPYTAEDPDLPYPGGPGETVEPSWVVVKKVGKENVQFVKIPKGKLLVMGDNRNDSNDARFWGLLDRDRLLGKAMVIFWPLTRMRIVR